MTVEAPTSLPAVNHALEPAWVRNGSPATQKTYATALAFEEMLVQQLSQSLTAASGLEGGASQGGEDGSEEGGSSFGASQLSSLLPQALSHGVMSAGGLGLAAQLTRDLQGTQGTRAQPAQASGGTVASAPADAVSPTNGGVGA